MRSATVAWFQKSVINPLDRLAFALRIPPPATRSWRRPGRRTGCPRVTPVCDCLEGETFWIVAQDGRRTEYVKNIEIAPSRPSQGQLVARRMAHWDGAHPR